jgi:hypothetical protein
MIFAAEGRGEDRLGQDPTLRLIGIGRVEWLFSPLLRKGFEENGSVRAILHPRTSHNSATIVQAVDPEASDAVQVPVQGYQSTVGVPKKR